MKASPSPVAASVCVSFVVLLLELVAIPGASGQVNFSTPPTYGGDGTVFVADFNGDGKLDILTSDGTLNLGNGDGTFTTGAPVVGGALAVADFNGDGKPDVLQEGTGTLVVLLGNGDGTFQPAISTNSGASLAVVAAADLNGDGRADVAGVFNNTLLVYLSKGDGTFAAGVPYNLGTLLPVDADMLFADFNGDNKIDVSVFTEGNGMPGQEIVLLGNGDGTFQSNPITSSGVVAPMSIVVGDFNGDGKLDLATAELVGSGSAQVATVVLQLGNGDGTFQTPTAVCTGPYSGFVFGGEGLALATADLNGDGKLDLVFVGNLIGIYPGNGDGTFSSTPTYYQPMSPGEGGLAIADFNSDGKPDLAVYGEILLGKGKGTFQGPPTVLLPNSAAEAAVGDFDKNGTQDVAAISVNSATSLYVLTNDGTGTLTLAHTYTLQQPSYAIATADVNGDGNLDLIVAGADPSTELWSYSVLLGNRDGSFQPPVFYAQNVQSAFASTIVIADFNHDGKLDLVIPTYQTVAVLLGKGDGTFGAPAYLYDGGPASIVSADFNGDGELDIAAAGSFGLAILLGKGDGTFQPAAFPFTTALSGLLTADLNADGKADLVSNNTKGIQVLAGNGNGTFTPLAPFGTFAIALADVDGDGNLDVITNDPDGSDALNGIYLGNGDGTFDPSEIRIPYSYPPHSAPSVIQVADMNGDGKQDLILESQIAVVVGPPYGSAFVLLNSTVPVPGAKFSPTSVSFPSQTVGTSSNPIPVTLTNTGAVALKVTKVTFTGADAGEFKQTNNCTTVEPLASCMINVTFAPTAAGVSSANLNVADNAGTGSQQVVVSGTVFAAPDFMIGPAPGSPSSSTIAAGKSATFDLAVTPIGSFSGTVSLTCSITPVEAPAPTCSLPSLVNVTAGTAAPVTVTVATAAPGTAGMLSIASLPLGGRLVTWTLVLFASGLVFVGNRRRLPALATPMIVLAFISMAGCGGGGSSPSHNTPGTPVGTYTATVTAASGSLSHKTTVTVAVQ
jgi:hypothetical protein